MISNNGDSRSNLFNLLYFYRNNEKISSEVSIMIRSLTSYFQTRKSETESLTRKGKIEFEDKDIHFHSEVNFDINRNISCEKSNIKLEPELPSLTPETLQEVTNVISKKPISVVDKLKKKMVEELHDELKEKVDLPSYTKFTSWYQDFEQQQMFTTNKNK